MMTAATNITPNARVGGLDWRIRPLDYAAQIEIEVMFLSTFGPAAGAALASAASGLAGAMVEVLTEVVGEGEGFDLAKLMDSEFTTDPRMRAGWLELMAGLGATMDAVLRLGSEALFAALDHRDVLRLYSLIMAAGIDVYADGEPRQVSDLAGLSAVCKHAPTVKWELLLAALMTTYAEQEQDEGADAGEGA
jgi:hypothetical protein